MFNLVGLEKWNGESEVKTPRRTNTGFIIPREKIIQLLKTGELQPAQLENLGITLSEAEAEKICAEGYNRNIQEINKLVQSKIFPSKSSTETEVQDIAPKRQPQPTERAFRRNARFIDREAALEYIQAHSKKKQ